MDIFKEAIAEAKAIREAAISNARDAMEESLTPHLKNMLAAKLQEMEEAESDEMVYEAEDEEEVEDVEDTEAGEEEDSEEDEPAEDDAEESEDEAEEEELDVEDMELEDLKNLIRDIVAQEMETGAGMDDAGTELGDEEGGVEDMIDTDMEPEMGADDEDEINLDELIAELESLGEGEEVEEEGYSKGEKEDVMERELNESRKKLKQAYKTINTMKRDLNEVNLLNSKLLYVSRILKAHNLSESQKVNLIATFDKAETIKEVKLVYETVSENINQDVKKRAKSKKQSLKEHKSFASKPAGKSTRGNIISEANEQVLRMQKLAGIIK